MFQLRFPRVRSAYIQPTNRVGHDDTYRAVFTGDLTAISEPAVLGTPSSGSDLQVGNPSFARILPSSLYQNNGRLYDGYQSGDPRYLCRNHLKPNRRFLAWGVARDRWLNETEPALPAMRDGAREHTHLASMEHRQGESGTLGGSGKWEVTAAAAERSFRREDSCRSLRPVMVRMSGEHLGVEHWYGTALLGR